MARKCGAKKISGFNLTDAEIEQVYESKIRKWTNGGAYIPILVDHGIKKVYVVVRK